MSVGNTQTTIPLEIRCLLPLIDSIAIKKAAQRVPNHLWTMSDAELETKYKPSRIGIALRAALWRGMREVVAKRNKIKLTDLAREAECSYPHAYELFTATPVFLVWVLRPVRIFSEELDPLLGPLLDRVNEVVHLPVKDAQGRVIFRNAEALLRAFEVLAPFVKN